MTLLGMTTSRTFNCRTGNADDAGYYYYWEQSGHPSYIPVTPHWTRSAVIGDCEAAPHDYLLVSIAR